MSTAVRSAPKVQKVKSSRRSQIVACAAASLFILGNFISSVGALTGPITGAWFVGTQKPRRGFLWMIAFAFVPGLIFGWRKIPLTGAVQALEYLGWTLVAAVLGALPFTFHRLVSPRLPGFLATLPLPLAAVAIHRSLWRCISARLKRSASSHSSSSGLPRRSCGCGTTNLASPPGLWRGLHRCGWLRAPSPFRGVALPANLPIGVAFSWVALAQPCF